MQSSSANRNGPNTIDKYCPKLKSSPPAVDPDQININVPEPVNNPCGSEEPFPASTSVSVPTQSADISRGPDARIATAASVPSVPAVTSSLCCPLLFTLKRTMPVAPAPPVDPTL